jgi:putative tricarboxylic transport membrane protein
MKTAEIVCAFGLLALAGLGIVEAVRLGPGWGPAGPRSGFFPFWLSVILALACLTTLVRAIRIPSTSETAKKRFVTMQKLKPVLAVFIPMAAAVALFEVIGFYFTSAIYLAFFMRWMGRHSWLATVTVSVLFPIAVLLILERWFFILLPKGLLGDYLPF